MVSRTPTHAQSSRATTSGVGPQAVREIADGNAERGHKSPRTANVPVDQIAHQHSRRSEPDTDCESDADHDSHTESEHESHVADEQSAHIVRASILAEVKLNLERLHLQASELRQHSRSEHGISAQSPRRPTSSNRPHVSRKSHQHGEQPKASGAHGTGLRNSDLAIPQAASSRRSGSDNADTTRPHSNRRSKSSTSSAVAPSPATRPVTHRHGNAPVTFAEPPPPAVPPVVPLAAPPVPPAAPLPVVVANPVIVPPPVAVPPALATGPPPPPLPAALAPRRDPQAPTGTIVIHDAKPYIRRWYVVTVGKGSIGVFDSWILSSRYCFNVPNAVYESYPTHAAALAAFQDAQEHGCTGFL